MRVAAIDKVSWAAYHGIAPWLNFKQWIIVVLTTVFLFLSSGMLSWFSSTYTVNISPSAKVSGEVKLVFYGNRYEGYKRDGNVEFSDADWTVFDGGDYTSLSAKNADARLRLHSDGELMLVSLIRYPAGGGVRIQSGTTERTISLTTEVESVLTLQVGGPASDIPPSAIHLPSLKSIILVIFAIFLALAIFAVIQVKCASQRSGSTFHRLELLGFIIPLLAATTLVLLVYWPGNVAYDGSLQWIQASERGKLYQALGTTATLFMRQFTKLSPSPATVIIFQTLLSALGTALILRELRYRGLSYWVAQAMALILAVLPQYPLFFTNLGKDALCAVGLLYMTWALLALFRTSTSDRSTLAYLCILLVSATFAASMRSNAVPAVLGVMALAIFILERQIPRRRLAWAILAASIFSVMLTPKLFLYLSDEYHMDNSKRSIYEKNRSPDSPLPLGSLANMYIFHVFSAALASGIELPPEDAALFYGIAPKSAWERYKCAMVDSTRDSVYANMTLSVNNYEAYMVKHQLHMAHSIALLIARQPGLILQRQACITEILWFIGVGERPFISTSTIGYDSVAPGFPLLAGENRPILPPSVKHVLQDYWSHVESPQYFWLYWKPGLALSLAFFVLLIQLGLRKDIGLMVAAMLPISFVIVLAAVIPFPAYRYVYPTLLLSFLLSGMAMAGQPLARSESEQGRVSI